MKSPLALVLFASLLLSASQADARGVRLVQEGDLVELRGLPALSADGKSLISRAESTMEDPLIETLRATTWGGIRQSYDFASARYESTEELLTEIRTGAKRLKRMIARRGFRQIKITRADSTGLVQVGEVSVLVRDGKLQLMEEGKLVYTRRIKKRASRGAGLMSDEAYDNLEVDFVGAYIDPVRRVFVVSYGSGTCDCACDLAPFFELYRWDPPVSAV